MKKYNYILLDWDGNIARTLDLWPEALNQVLQKRGYSLTREQLIESTWGFVAYVAKHTDISAVAIRLLLRAARMAHHQLSFVDSEGTHLIGSSEMDEVLDYR